MNPNSAKYKTSMCRHLLEKGYCSMKEKCHFAHSHQEQRTPQDPLPENINVQLKPLSIFKTQLCKYFQKGYCQNGAKCTYAHGETDLRSMPVAPVGDIKQHYRLPMSPVIPPSPIYPYFMSPPITMMPGMPMMMPVKYSQPRMDVLNGSIINNLYQVFPMNEGVMKQLIRAQEHVQQGQGQQAGTIIQQILKDSSRTTAETEKMRRIFSNANYLHSLQSPFIFTDFST